MRESELCSTFLAGANANLVALDPKRLEGPTPNLKFMLHKDEQDQVTLVKTFSITKDVHVEF